MITKEGVAWGAVLMALLLLIVPVSAIGGNEAWIQVRCNVEGASIYFDGEYKGQIAGGELNVPVYVTGTPYTTAKAVMDGYYSSSTSIGSYPAVGETRTVYITLNPTPTPAPATTGTLSVTSSPSGAKVYVDGSYYGRTSQYISGLSAGDHRIEVALDGYETWKSTARVKAGQVTDVYASLTHKPTLGSIYVSSSPSGANIYLDGVYKGTTPRTLSGIAEGRHYVDVELAGYQEWSGPVGVVANQQAHISASLTPESKPVFGTIAVYSDPVGAYIYLDGAYQGRTYPEGFVVIGVSPGAHTVTLKLDGYKDAVTSVNVNSGRQSTVRSTLQTPGAGTGAVEIASDPAGAEVYLNNVYKGVTPMTLTDLAPGSYTTALKLKGYVDWTTTATVNAGATTPVSAQLAAVPPTTQKSPGMVVPALGAIAILGAVLALRRH